MTTIDQIWIENRMKQYLLDQHQITITNLRNQFENFPPDQVEAAIQSLIDTNAFLVRFDEHGVELLFVGPNI